MTISESLLVKVIRKLYDNSSEWHGVRVVGNSRAKYLIAFCDGKNNVSKRNQGKVIDALIEKGWVTRLNKRLLGVLRKG